MPPQIDDAIQFLIDFLRRPSRPEEAAEYGYDLYIPKVCRTYAREIEHVNIQNPSELEMRIRPLSQVFYEAAWELCRRGILRPSVRRIGEQVTQDGSGGSGYSVTGTGRSWLDSNENILIPVDPSRVGQMLTQFRISFGDGYFQRAQEAIRCYSAGVYLASCVMCGAAVESILLHIAIRRDGDENNVLRLYRTANGRRRVENLVLNGVGEPNATTFRSLTDLIKYWRDDAAHGIASNISEFEAYEAIARLIRFAHFAEDNFLH